MRLSEEPQRSLQLPREWRAKFMALLAEEYSYGHPLVTNLVADRDTLVRASELVRQYVASTNPEDTQGCSYRDIALKQSLERALKGVRLTKKIFESVHVYSAKARAGKTFELANPQRGFALARELEDILTAILGTAHSYGGRERGTDGDLETVDMLDWLLQMRLGESSPHLLSVLLTFGFRVEGREPQSIDPDTIGKALRDYRETESLSRHTEDYIRYILQRKQVDSLNAGDGAAQ